MQNRTKVAYDLLMDKGINKKRNGVPAEITAEYAVRFLDHAD